MAPIAFFEYGMYLNGESTYLHRLIVLNSFCYFIYDFIAEYYFGCLDFLTCAHHVISMLVLSACFHNNYGGYEYVMTQFLGEISNPWLIIRTMLKITGKTDNLFYKCMEWLFAVSFLILRLFVAPFWLELLL